MAIFSPISPLGTRLLIRALEDLIVQHAPNRGDVGLGWKQPQGPGSVEHRYPINIHLLKWETPHLECC